MTRETDVEEFGTDGKRSTGTSGEPPTDALAVAAGRFGLIKPQLEEIIPVLLNFLFIRAQENDHCPSEII